MKTIIKENFEELCYSAIDIEENISVLEYLKQYEKNTSFVLHHIDRETFEKFKNIKMDKETMGILSYIYKPIAGYNKIGKIDYTLPIGGGGLKISDHEEKIRGSFIIEDNKIVYDGSVAFFRERDSYIYCYAKKYYTTMTMRELLMQELERKRQLLIYMGTKSEGYQSIPLFEEVNKEKMLEYASNPKLGEQAFNNRKH